MTELEKISYAKTFIDKLAIGIDPTDDTTIPDGDLIRKPRLSNCLHFVSGVLSKIIDHPDLVTEMYKKTEWIVTPQVISSIECSCVRVSVGTFAKRIDEALGSTRKFTATEINNWLVYKGFVESRVADGDFPRCKQPTEKGCNLGLKLDSITKDNGRIKQYLRCDINAQKYIRDNLEEIVLFAAQNNSKDKSSKAVANTPFSLTQDELSNFQFSSKPILISEIADRLNSLKKNDEMRKIKATDITDWLVKIGILKKIYINENTFKLPGQEGARLGISVDHRTGKQGQYTVALYNMEAQKFIIDNIYAVFELLN